MPRMAILYNGIVEVTGSIPVGSTNRMKGLARDGWALRLFEDAIWAHGSWYHSSGIPALRSPAK